jgi:hypothetical protein
MYHRLAIGIEENQRRLGEAGVCEMVTGAMRTLPADRDVQFRGCIAIVR